MSLLINSKAPKAITIGGKAVKSLSINGDVVWKNGPDYFYFEDRSGAANTISCTKTGSETEWLSLEYSTDKETWTSWDLTQSISLAANSKVYLRGNNTAFMVSAGNFHSFSSTGNVYAGGTVRSLFDKTVPDTINAVQRMCGCMFYGMTHLVGINANLFKGINNNSNAGHIFNSTFYNCSSLLNVPDLSDFNANGAVQVFRSMFQNCTSLTSAPDLSHVTSVATSGMYQMFRNCISLVTPPDLSSITSVGNTSMYQMLSGCTSLATAYAPTVTWDTNKTDSWLDGVAASGTLYADASIASTIPTDNASGCPTGWTVVNL